MVFSQKLADQYAALKAEAGEDCLVLMQVGSFMQVQGEDARAVSAVTGLKLQMAGDVDAPAVLGGFPKSGLDAYVGKLVRAGHSVAIALQDENKQRCIAEVISLNGSKNGSAQPRPPSAETERIQGEPAASRDKGQAYGKV